MGQTFQQLGQLLFDSIPTIIVFLLLHFYLKRVLYRPLRQVLDARAARIDGKLEAASRTIAAAERKLADYEETLRQHRVASFRRVEAQRQKGLGEGQQVVSQARHESAQALVAARQQVAADTAQAHAHLQTSADALANQILQQVLARKAMPTPGAAV